MLSRILRLLHARRSPPPVKGPTGFGSPERILFPDYVQDMVEANHALELVECPGPGFVVASDPHNANEPFVDPADFGDIPMIIHADEDGDFLGRVHALPDTNQNGCNHG